MLSARPLHPQAFAAQPPRSVSATPGCEGLGLWQGRGRRHFGEGEVPFCPWAAVCFPGSCQTQLRRDHIVCRACGSFLSHVGRSANHFYFRCPGKPGCIHRTVSMTKEAAL